MGQVRDRCRRAPTASVIISHRYFAKLPVASPSSVQVENTHFAQLIKVLTDNTAQMVGTESKTQILLKFRFALHLLTFVNEDSRLLLLKLANVIAGLTCAPFNAPRPS